MAGIKTVAGSGFGNALIDSHVWGGQAWDLSTGPITVYFGQTVQDWFDAGGASHDGYVSLGGSVLDPWSPAEKAAFGTAMALYASVCGVTFQEVGNAKDADIVWWQAEIDALGIHEPPGPGQRWAVFNPKDTTSWGHFGLGGDGLNTVIHELGHGLGLAHPHDGGVEPDATRFPGVKDSEDRGTDRLNQGIWTVMSYNTGFEGTPAGLDYGAQGGLGALDIAALQALYGANTTTRTGDDVYGLPSANRFGTGWSCIWDAGGNDTISAATAKVAVTIDLRAAPLVGRSAGGFVSSGLKIGGGFTIANGVWIENAVGGSKGDTLTGNASANVLNGRGGADRMNGLGGDDTYCVDNTADRVVDTGGGHDAILTSASYTLDPRAAVEILQALKPTSRAALKLCGNAASNAITGNAGANVLDGKGGNDDLTGGAGRDSFLFDTKPSGSRNADHILDFSVRDDTIRLDHAVFHGLGKAGSLRGAAFHVADAGPLAHDRSDRVIYDLTTGSLYFDPDGTGRHGPTKFAQIDAGLALKASDFYVV